MIKVEEIAEKYKGYEVDEEKLKEFLTPPKPKTVWDLEYHDAYYNITADGHVYANSWDNCEVDSYIRNIGNCFLTKEEAKFEVERRKVEAILLKYGRREFKQGEENHYMYCNLLESSIEFDCYKDIQHQGIIYFDTEKLSQQAIEEAGEDNIKKYIFGVVD